MYLEYSKRLSYGHRTFSELSKTGIETIVFSREIAPDAIGESSWPIFNVKEKYCP